MKRIYFVIVFLFIHGVSYAQSANAFTDSEIIWMGLDFSKLKCVGPEGFSDPEQIKEYYFDEWNELVIKESNKYNLFKAYDKKRVMADLSVVKERNKLPEVNALVVDEDYNFDESNLPDIITSYHSDIHNTGVGLVFVVESFNKVKEEAIIHVIFFDLSSKKILWTNNYSAAPMGFGFRNYWASTFASVIEASSGDFFKAQREHRKQVRKQKR